MSISHPAALILVRVEENRGGHEGQELYLIVFRNVVLLVVFIAVVVTAALAILGGSGSSSNSISGISNSGRL
jgi:hypothetical protein